MADKKVSAFTATLAVDGTEALPILQSGVNKIVLLSAVKASYLDTLYQPLDTDLTAITGLVSAANKVPYFTGAGTAAVADFTAAGRALVDDESAAAQCTTLGVGTTDTPVFAGQVIQAASPVLTFKDSSCIDADANATITIAATDTGSGTEDADVYIYQQVNGSLFACFYADADGPVVIGYNGQPTIMSNASRVQSTAPVFKLIDTDAVDGDEGVSFAAACTTVTAGAEDVDFTISQQIGGSPVTFLDADADSSITIGDGTRKVYVVNLTALVRVVINAGTAQPSPNESGSVITNEGHTSGSVIELPTAQAGLVVEGIVQTAQTVTITANTGDTIRIGSNVTAAAGSITSNVVGSAITLKAINATEWFATSTVGTWTI